MQTEFQTDLLHELRHVNENLQSIDQTLMFYGFVFMLILLFKNFGNKK